MSSQGSKSNTNGKALQLRIYEYLKEKGYDVLMEVNIGPVSPISATDVRADVMVNNIIIECKEFSGQQGTIWKKIVADLLVYSRVKGRVVFVMGNRCPPGVFAALAKAKELVSPNTEFMLEDDFYAEADSWTPDEF